MVDTKPRVASSHDSFSLCLGRFTWTTVANPLLFFAATHSVEEPALTLS
jgi:hypothetical protein